MKKILLSLSVALCPLSLLAQPAQLPDKPSTVVIDSGRSTDSFVFRSNEEAGATCKIVDGAVYDVDVAKSTKTQYSVELAIPTQVKVSKGDVAIARLCLRTLSAHQETAECAVYFYFQMRQSPYNKSIITQLACGPEWTTYDIPFVVSDDMEAGTAIAAFGLGSLAQHVQIRDLVVLDYAKEVRLSDLPDTKFTYKGREEGAAWREEAMERIKELRTAPISVSVVDAKGRPVRGAEVSVHMTRSAFLWGTAVDGSTLIADTPESETYREKLKELFNEACLGNGYKHGGWSWPDARKVNSLRASQWLYDNGFRQRGHNLVWPGWKFNTAAMREAAKLLDKEAFSEFVKASFYERMAFAKGKVEAWDVVNEPMHEKEMFERLPEDVMVEWFQLAKKLDPDSQLFINDYAMLNGSQSPANIAEYISLIKDLVAKGAPIEGIGVQGHIGTLPRSPMQVISDLDMFKDLGIPVQITEFDINTKDEELQADYMRDFLIAVYSHPVIEGVQMWGFWQADHWKPDAALYRRDWSEKPCAKAWKDLVCGEWKTSFTVATDRKGVVGSRGHFGKYTLDVTYKGKTVAKEFELGPDGYDVQIVLE